MDIIWYPKEDVMPRFRVENQHDGDPEPREYSRWELWQERFWKWYYHGSSSGRHRRRRQWWWTRVYSVPALYGNFIQGEIGKDGLYKRLRANQVPGFLALHERVRAALESGEVEIPVELTIQLTKAFMDRRRLTFALIQVDHIMPDLEREVIRRSGGVNVVSREA